MPDKALSPDAVARNLRLLLDHNKWSEHKLATKSGIAQKTINNILNEESSPTVATTSRLASAFRVDGWVLMLPNMPADISTHSLNELVDHYSKASPEGREYIKRIAEKEAGYTA